MAFCRRSLAISRALSLKQSMISDRGIDIVSNFNKLDFLVLECPNLDDTRVLELQLPDSLETLSLSTTRVTDKGVERLIGRCPLPHLKEVQLNETSITDKSLALLANHPTLERLELHQVWIDDDGLKHLTKLTRGYTSYHSWV